MGAYKEEFPVGSGVKIIDTSNWKSLRGRGNTIIPSSASRWSSREKTTEVEGVAFYHGGDALYKLSGLPGYWHEQRLKAATKS